MVVVILRGSMRRWLHFVVHHLTVDDVRLGLLRSLQGEGTGSRVNNRPLSVVHEEVVQLLVRGLRVLVMWLVLLRLQDVLELRLAEVATDGAGGDKGGGEDGLEHILLVLREEVADLGRGLDFIRHRGSRARRGGCCCGRFLRAAVVV